MQERGETVRNLAADTSRRLQQLESDVGRIETLLDVVRDESTAIRAGQTELKHILTQSGGGQAPARNIKSIKTLLKYSISNGIARLCNRLVNCNLVVESDVPAPRLQVLLAGMNSLRATTNGLKDELILVSKNVSALTNLTK